MKCLLDRGGEGIEGSGMVLDLGCSGMWGVARGSRCPILHWGCMGLVHGVRTAAPLVVVRH